MRSIEDLGLLQINLNQADESMHRGISGSGGGRGGGL